MPNVNLLGQKRRSLRYEQVASPIHTYIQYILDFFSKKVGFKLNFSQLDFKYLLFLGISELLCFDVTCIFSISSI